MSAISDGIFLFIIILITIIFPQNNVKGGNPAKFATIIVFSQKFFLRCFDLPSIFSINLNVINRVIEYRDRKVKKHTNDTILLINIQELLFIEEIAIIFFISNLGVSCDKEAKIVPIVINNITLSIEDLSCIVDTSRIGKIFCHVIMIIIDLCFISNVVISFMYHP